MAVSNVLVIGGGVAGMTAAIGLRRNGFAVEIAEINPDWSVLGLGIALLGPTLRALQTIGLLEPCLQLGFGFSSFSIGNPAGQIVRENELPRLLGPDTPAAVGIMRPTFHRVLTEACTALGVPVRLGVTVRSIDQSETTAAVEFSDGSTQRYDLVIVADGAYSKTRDLVFGAGLKPQFTGQMVWRATVPRLPEVNSLHVYYGGPNQPGMNPVSADQMYVFLVECAPDNPRLPAERLAPVMREQLASYQGPLAVARERITSPDQIVYRPIDAFLAPPPWHRGCVVLIGDAAHVPTPHLASGAGLAIEDAIVLVELLTAQRASNVSITAVFDAFMARRYERCRMVVENSKQFGQWELHPGTPGADPAGLMNQSMMAMAKPI